MSTAEAKTEPDDEAEPLLLLAGIHYLLGMIVVFFWVLSIPILLGTLIGISLIGMPGTGTPVAARGPVLNYIRTTGPFPNSGPLIQIIGFLRTGFWVTILLITGVGLEERLQLAWYAVLILYGFVIVSSWPNWFGILIGVVALLVAWSGREYLAEDLSVLEQFEVLMESIGEKWGRFHDEVVTG